MATRTASSEPTVRPLTARSAVLSLLLGLHPPQLPVRDLVRAADFLGIAEATLRVALTRMVAAGELDRVDTTYRLSGAMLTRQRRQDEAYAPRTTTWRGGWELAVVVTAGRGQAERAELRTTMTDLRLAEVREGVWMRPDNLARTLPHTDHVLHVRRARPDVGAAELVSRLWDLDGWAGTGSVLLERLADGQAAPGQRLATAAAILRHLLTDPVLPAELTPPGWPADPLRRAYAEYSAATLRATTA